jgi:phosphoglycolate phosphatase
MVAYFTDIVWWASLLGKQRKINKLLAKYAIPWDDAVYVGDEVRDAQACAKIDLDFVPVARGYSHPKKLAEYAPVMYSWEELIELLQ